MEVVFPTKDRHHTCTWQAFYHVTFYVSTELESHQEQNGA